MGRRSCGSRQRCAGIRGCVLCATLLAACCLTALHYLYSHHLYDVYSFTPHALGPQPGGLQRHRLSTFKMTSTHGHSKPNMRSSHGHSKPNMRSSYGHSTPNMRSSHGHSKPNMRSSHGHSKPNMRSSHGHSKPNMRSSHGHSKPNGRSSHGHSTPKMTAPRQDCEDLTFQTDEEELRTFLPAMSGRERCRLLDTMDAFHTAMRHAGVPYFMYSGTLLGSWRHHGVVPWDDVIDLMVPKRQAHVVFQALKALAPGFVLDTSQEVLWKLYRADSDPIPNVKWKFPSLDILFYSGNKTLLWDNDQRYQVYVVPTHWIFPLRLRPFHGRLLSAPWQTGRVLRKTYSLRRCKIGYSHRLERWVPGYSGREVPCQRLHSLLPFVQRVKGSGGCVERLVIGGRVLSNFTDSEAC